MGVPVRSNHVVVGSLLGKPNTKKLTRIYNEAFQQVSSLWKMLPQSVRTNLKSESGPSESMEVDGSLSTKSKLKDLEDRVNSLKGKQTSYKEKMAKKKLKNQLKKKKKLQEKNLLKVEVRQKKKELKAQKLAEKIKNGEITESALEKRIGKVAEDVESSDDENELEEPEKDADDVEVPPPKKTKKNQQKKTNIEDLSQNGAQEDEGNLKGSSEGLSKKKQKFIQKKEQKAEKKREKRKLWRMKKKEEAAAAAQELIKTKLPPVVQEQKDEPSEVLFNKIDFEGENVKKKFKKEKPRAEKDPKRALDKIEELNKKITDLKEMGAEEKAAAIKSKESWKAAILKADGVKVKDDVRLLKKTIRRKEKQKTKSKTDWAKRKEVTERKISDAQKKRKENIQNKKKEKKQKKIKKSIKKGRVVI